MFNESNFVQSPKAPEDEPGVDILQIPEYGSGDRVVFCPLDPDASKDQRETFRQSFSIVDSRWDAFKGCFVYSLKSPDGKKILAGVEGKDILRDIFPQQAS